MKLAILDKDGTLVLPKSGNTFVQNPADQILMTGVVEGCQRLIEAGYVLAIASNQGGVSAGHKTLDEAISEMRYCLHLLKGFDIDIRMAMFCPDFEGQECYVVSLDEVFELVDDNGEEGQAFEQFVGTFRKPGAGMLKAAANGSQDAWMIGDREEDKLAAEAAGFGFLDADRWRKGASPWII
jgi:D-glycero-D-manno-heptose 1,7-bisphosphate phosphatase